MTIRRPGRWLDPPPARAMRVNYSGGNFQRVSEQTLKFRPKSTPQSRTFEQFKLRFFSVAMFNDFYSVKEFILFLLCDTAQEFKLHRGRSPLGNLLRLKDVCEGDESPRKNQSIQI